jgi:hypothetical protein
MTKFEKIAVTVLSIILAVMITFGWISKEDAKEIKANTIELMQDSLATDSLVVDSLAMPEVTIEVEQDSVSKGM